MILYLLALLVVMMAMLTVVTVVMVTFRHRYQLITTRITTNTTITMTSTTK